MDSGRPKWPRYPCEERAGEREPYPEVFSSLMPLTRAGPASDGAKASHPHSSLPAGPGRPDGVRGGPLSHPT